MSCITAGVKIYFAVVCDWHGLNRLPVGILIYFVIPRTKQNSSQKHELQFYSVF